VCPSNIALKRAEDLGFSARKKLKAGVNNAALKLIESTRLSLHNIELVDFLARKRLSSPVTGSSRGR
jgi:hypothetical protein